MRRNDLPSHDLLAAQHAVNHAVLLAVLSVRAEKVRINFSHAPRAADFWLRAPKRIILRTDV